MAAPALSQDKASTAVTLVEECLREGFCPPDMTAKGRAAISEAAQRAVERGLCHSPNSFRTRLRIARENYGLVPDWTLYRPPQYQYSKPTRKSPVGSVPPMPDRIAEPEGNPTRVLAIGDTHDDPRLPDKARFTWMGRCAADLKVDRVIQIGDWGTWDSVSSHEDRASIQGRALPSFEDDMASFRMSLMAFDRGLGGYGCPRDVTEGNHEKRVEVYENKNPVLEGGMMRRVREAFTQYGWRTRPFGEYLFVQGVGFVHVPLNIMGKPYGGKTLNPIANDAVFSIVFGHSHKGGHASVPKIGPSCKIDILNIACALPHGYVESYARMGTTGWEWGVFELTLHAGQITSRRWLSMIELRNRYSDDGADVAA